MKLKALRKKPFGQWELIKVENTAEAMKEKIGGLAEIRPVGNGLNLVSLQHRGHLDSNAKFNFTKGGYAFFGTVLLFGSDEEDPEEFGDVPADLVQELEGTTKTI